MNAFNLPIFRLRCGALLRLGALLLCTLAAQAQTTWTLRNGGGSDGELLWGVTDGNAGVVAVGNSGRILHSADGKTWTAESSGTSVWLVAVTFGNGRYVAVGDRGTILTSTDAITWTAATKTGTTARLNNVLYAQGKYVAVGEAGTVIVSTDGKSWNTSTSGVNSWLHGLAYGSGHWVATGENGVVVYSTDGISWKQPSYPQAGDHLEAVVLAQTIKTDTYSSIYFLAVGANGTTRIIQFYSWGTSAESVSTWNPSYQGIGTKVRLGSLTVYNNVFIATGDSGTVLTAKSYSGPWTKLDLGTTKLINAAGFALGSLFLAGESDTVYQSEPIFPSRLGNISTRGVTSTGDNVMIAGTIISGERAKQILVRGVGPKLGSYGVSGVLSDPVLTVYDADGKPVAENSGWGKNLNVNAVSDATKAVGAFELPGGSRDAAMIVTLNPGAYTFQVTSESKGTGVVLVEAYDMDSLNAIGPRAVNISTRGMVGTDDKIMIAGLIVQGPSSRTLLVRGIGPTLSKFNVPGLLADPVVTVYQGDTPIASNDNWGTTTTVYGREVTAADIRAACTATGAFALTEDSKDAALLINLAPGAYTIQVTGKDRTTGVALVEAYEVPTE